MKTQEAIDAFGGVRQLAHALNISTQAIYFWGEDVPELRVYQIKQILAERSA